MTVREQCIGYISAWCNNSFKDAEGAVDLPPSVVLAADRMSQGLSNAPAGVTSKTQEGAFVSGSDMGRVFEEVKYLCSPFRRIKTL